MSISRPLKFGAFGVIVFVALCTAQQESASNSTTESQAEDGHCFLPQPDWVSNTHPIGAAKAAGNSKQVVIVDKPFPACAAEHSFIDPRAPLLTKDGWGAANQPKLGSSECLLAGVVNGRFPDPCYAKPSKERTTPLVWDKTAPAQVEIKLDYVIINLVRWRLQRGKPVSDSDWYLYDRRHTSSGTVKSRVSGDLRLVGGSNVGFLALHFGIDDTCDIRYTVEAKKRTPQNVADFQQAIGIAANLLGGKLGSVIAGEFSTAALGFIAGQPGTKSEAVESVPGVGVFGFASFKGIEKLPYDLTLSGDAGETPRASNKNGESVTYVAVDAARRSIGELVTRSSAVGAKATWSTNDAPVTCDPKRSATPNAASTSSPAEWTPTTRQWHLVLASGRVPDDPSGQSGETPATESQPKDSKSTNKSAVSADNNPLQKSYTNEGLYRWDLSLGLPLKTATQLKYNASDGTVRTTKSNPENVYVFFDFFPRKVDLVKSPPVRWPSLSLGIPLANQPFNRATAGLSVGFNIWGLRIAPFAGVLFLREFRPNTLGVGAKATSSQLQSDLVPHHNYRLLVTLNFSVKDAAKLVKSSTGNKTADPATGKGSGGSKSTSQ